MNPIKDNVSESETKTKKQQQWKSREEKKNFLSSWSN